MKVLGICVILTLIFNGINCIKNKKVKCYRCSDCPNPFDKTQITELGNCNFCRTVYTYRDEDNYRIAKDCVASCVPQDRRGGKAGLVTECCDEDYCNASPKHYSISFLLITTFTIFITYTNQFIY
ncbi:unnamed protein product [Schistosoma rodhaini]|uniref:Toxin_TOLIP domain-containing protein n=1 Tax=Schistosoma rodhaini TaxID=6188 RepID=A0AA85ETL2_9TREM|nr:unnamed protein product [Schistosoma rodhaini]CAH8492314.1 unnamed protein product [Schistosoma rodhaini]